MKRVLCLRCERPLSVCLCHGLETAEAPFDLVLLQTRREQKHALNSGRIVRLAVQGCQVFIGEDFSDHKDFHVLLERYQGRVWLLYPGERAVSPDALVNDQTCKAGRGLLIVLDATWRKSRRMLHLFPALADLPRISLPETHVSSYRIRKVPGDGYISTVEAVTSVLEQTGHPPALCRQMLGAFERLVDNQISAMGKDTFMANYDAT